MNLENKVIDRLVSESTGNIIEIREGDNLRKTTKKQREIINNKTKFIKNKEEEFIWMLYNYCDKLNLDLEGIERSDIPKLTYISTFINYDGYLTNYNKSMDKLKLKSIIGVSEKTFYKFYNKMINLNIFIEEDTRIKINKSLFIKGKISEDETNSDFSRMYVGTVRYLYENVSSKHHDMLGIYFRLIPFMHRQRNIICKNPESPYEEIKLLTAKELSDLIGYRHSVRTFITDMLKVRLNNGESIITFIRNTVDEGGSKMIINYKVAYGGTHYLLEENRKQDDGLFLE